MPMNDAAVSQKQKSSKKKEKKPKQTTDEEVRMKHLHEPSPYELEQPSPFTKRRELKSRSNGSTASDGLHLYEEAGEPTIRAPAATPQNTSTAACAADPVYSEVTKPRESKPVPENTLSTSQRRGDATAGGAAPIGMYELEKPINSATVVEYAVSPPPLPDRPEGEINHALQTDTTDDVDDDAQSIYSGFGGEDSSMVI